MDSAKSEQRDDGHSAETSAAGPTLSPLMPVAAPRIEGEIALFDSTEVSARSEQWNSLYGQLIARNVSQPTITPFLPAPEKASGAAVIIAPGGGFKILSMDHEGWTVAKWLAEQGIAAFVLKYTLNETANDDAEFAGEMQSLIAALGADSSGLVISEPRATRDVLAAIVHIKANSAKWGIDPERLGIIGFSAGAIASMNALREADDQSRAAFLGYIYGPMIAIPTPTDAPPLFVALAIDDPLFGSQGYGLIEKWREKAPVELHAYERGGHGFGMGSPDNTTGGMMTQFVTWLRSRGLLQTVETAAVAGDNT